MPFKCRDYSNDARLLELTINSRGFFCIDFKPVSKVLIGRFLHSPQGIRLCERGLSNKYLRVTSAPQDMKFGVERIDVDFANTRLDDKGIECLLFSNQGSGPGCYVQGSVCLIDAVRMRVHGTDYFEPRLVEAHYKSGRIMYYVPTPRGNRCIIEEPWREDAKAS